MARTRTAFARCGWTLALTTAAVIAVGAAPPRKAGSRKQARQSQTVSKNSARIIAREDPAQNATASTSTELWLFGISDVKRMKPFNAQGTRTIIDLRTFDTAGAISFLEKMSTSGKGAAICLRWKNPNHEGDRPVGQENYDVPPSAEESSAALSALAEVLSSAPARAMGKRLYVQIYNEIGGGPGTFALDDVDAMLAFADTAVPAIRSANPDVRICGPALSGAQLAQYGVEPTTEGGRLKREQIDRWMSWTAANADVTDVHLNGENVDAGWADQALSNMRQILDSRGGQNVGLVSFEWSCSGYPDRTDSAGIEAYIHDVWEAMKQRQVQVAAYTYWPLFDQPEEVRSRTSWASVIGEDKKPNKPVTKALTSIGKSP